MSFSSANHFKFKVGDKLYGNGWGWGSLDKPVQASNVNIMIEGAGVIGGLDQPEKAEHKKTNTCM